MKRNYKSDSRPFGGQSEPKISPELEVLAHWMDTVFHIPGVGLRFGLDSLIGLLPGIGDTATSVVSLYILNAATRYGVPRVTLMRMAANIAIDWIIGAIPLLGDAFDIYWKSNQRNLELLRKHANATPMEERKLQRGDRLFVGMLIAGLIVILIGSIATAYWLIAQLFRLLF
jgi:hypothetical protein